MDRRNATVAAGPCSPRATNEVSGRAVLASQRLGAADRPTCRKQACAFRNLHFLARCSEAKPDGLAGSCKLCGGVVAARRSTRAGTSYRLASASGGFDTGADREANDAASRATATACVSGRAAAGSTSTKVAVSSASTTRILAASRARAVHPVRAPTFPKSAKATCPVARSFSA